MNLYFFGGMYYEILKSYLRVWCCCDDDFAEGGGTHYAALFPDKPETASYPDALPPELQ